MALSMMDEDKATLYDKASQHDLIYHVQYKNGIVLLKAAEVVGPDLEATLNSIESIISDYQSHEEQLKIILKILGTWEMTGKDISRELLGA